VLDRMRDMNLRLLSVTEVEAYSSDQ
jgi:hypothetical protein